MIYYDVIMLPDYHLSMGLNDLFSMYKHPPPYSFKFSKRDNILRFTKG